MTGDRISSEAVSATQAVNSEQLNPGMSLDVFTEHMECVHHCSLLNRAE